MITFLPIALLVQYTKLGNVFWTIQTIINASDESVQTQNPFILLGLVSIIVGLGIVKEYLSDRRRSIADKQVNETMHRRVVKVSQQKDDSQDITPAFFRRTFFKT